MIHGNKNLIFLIVLILFFSSKIYSEEKISSSPLINIDKIKPSFDEVEEKNENLSVNRKLKKKIITESPSKTSHAVLIGLDKITAKSSKIIVNLNETTNFGPLQIKILKCGIMSKNNKLNNVAYMQVKDTSKSENEKVFIFNGWTFSSDPNLTPFDHAIYDLQLLKCNT